MGTWCTCYNGAWMNSSVSSRNNNWWTIKYGSAPSFKILLRSILGQKEQELSRRNNCRTHYQFTKNSVCIGRSLPFCCGKWPSKYDHCKKRVQSQWVFFGTKMVDEHTLDPSVLYTSNNSYNLPIISFLFLEETATLFPNSIASSQFHLNIKWKWTPIPCVMISLEFLIIIKLLTLVNWMQLIPYRATDNLVRYFIPDTSIF